jgi:hypothetical protein
MLHADQHRYQVLVHYLLCALEGMNLPTLNIDLWGGGGCNLCTDAVTTAALPDATSVMHQRCGMPCLAPLCALPKHDALLLMPVAHVELCGAIPLQPWVCNNCACSSLVVHLWHATC